MIGGPVPPRERGHLFHGAPTLLITMIGRRSGLPRRSALIYGRDGDRYLAVASNGGAGGHPLARPQVKAQTGACSTRWPPGGRGRAASPVGDDDRDLAALRRLPAQSSPQIPIMIIERAATPDPG
ncbi:nitroreductase/quinone reductase family protein [Nonomuraea wenchangensis]